MTQNHSSIPRAQPDADSSTPIICAAASSISAFDCDILRGAFRSSVIEEKIPQDRWRDHALLLVRDLTGREDVEPQLLDWIIAMPLGPQASTSAIAYPDDLALLKRVYDCICQERQFSPGSPEAADLAGRAMGLFTQGVYEEEDLFERLRA